MEKEFRGKNWGTDQVDLRSQNIQMQGRPVEVHVKEDGTWSDEPTFTFIMDNITMRDVLIRNTKIFGQISLEMLNDGLADAGYKIVKI